MPRKLRVEYEGAVYHVMNRGHRWETIFQDDDQFLISAYSFSLACDDRGGSSHLTRGHTLIGGAGGDAPALTPLRE